MGLLKYVVRSAWREVGLMARLLWVVGIAVPAGLSTLAGRADIPFLGWLASLLPWWGWLIIAAFVATNGLLIAISKRAYRLDEEKMPRLVCNSIRIWNNDGEYFVRVQLQNVSANDINGAKPYLDNIEADDPLRQIETIDFRLPLYTQERLRERFTAANPVTYPARPVDFSAKQPKWLELFQITEAMERQLHLVVADGRKDIIPPAKMEFKCSVYSIASLIEFSVIYEESGDGWRVSLVNEGGHIIGPIMPAARDE